MTVPSAAGGGTVPPDPAEGEGVEHGRLSSYTIGKCRCDECKAAAASYMRAYRAKNAPLRARARGLTRLGQRYPAERDALINEERAKGGLPALRPVGRPRKEPAS